MIKGIDRSSREHTRDDDLGTHLEIGSRNTSTGTLPPSTNNLPRPPPCDNGKGVVLPQFHHTGTLKFLPIDSSFETSGVGWGLREVSKLPYSRVRLPTIEKSVSGQLRLGPSYVSGPTSVR